MDELLRLTRKPASAPVPIRSPAALQRSDFTEWYERQLFSSQPWPRVHGRRRVLPARRYAKEDAPYETRFEYGLDTNGNLFTRSAVTASRSATERLISPWRADLSYTPLPDYREAVFSVCVAYSDNNRDAQRRDPQSFRPAPDRRAAPVAGRLPRLITTSARTV
jgi:hypothetical protein